MPKQTPRNHHLKEYNFQTLSKTETNPKARIRLLILHHLKNNSELEDIAKDFGYNPQTIGIIRRKFWEHGIESIYDKPRKGRTSKLAEKDIEPFKQAIIEAQEQRGGGRLTALDIVEIAKKDFNAHYSQNDMYHLLNRIGMSWISSRSRHPKANEEAQEAFKKTS